MDRVSSRPFVFWSQRKSEAPHAVTITLKSEDGRGIVTEAKCSCKAG